MDTTRKRGSDGASVREIAKLAGTSASTVSRVLNNRNTKIPIAEETRRAVLDASRRLKYQPNIHAKRLFARRSNSIAVMVPPRGGVLPGAASYADPNLARTLGGMLEVATDAEQHLIVMASDMRAIKRREHLNLFRNRSIDGMLIWGAVEEDWSYINELRDEGHPFVLVNSHVKNSSVPHVSVDNQAGASEIAEHLIKLGHRRIAFLAGPDTASIAVDRRDMFVKVCRDGGVDVTVATGEFSLESGCALAMTLLSGAQRPTAIAAVDDLMALGVLEAAEASGLRVPNDLSVTGADHASAYCRPQLTTFEAPMERLGRLSFKLLMRLLEEPQAWPRIAAAGEHITKGKMVLGQTTAAAPCDI